MDDLMALNRGSMQGHVQAPSTSMPLRRSSNAYNPAPLQRPPNTTMPGRRGSSGGGPHPANLLTLSSGERALFDALFDFCDKARIGLASSTDIFNVFITSRLSKTVLGEVWNLANVNKRSGLSRKDFYVAMRAIAAAQHRLPVNMQTLRQHQQLPYPKLAVQGFQPPPNLPPGNKSPASPLMTPQQQPVIISTQPNTQPNTSPPPPPPPPTASDAGVGGQSDWSMSAMERTTYGNYFQQADADHDGFVSGGEAQAFFAQSKLPNSLLGQIWQLADEDKDNRLSPGEFATAMHIIMRVRSRQVSQVPDTLPQCLSNLKQQQAQPPPQAPPQVATLTPTLTPTPLLSLVSTPEPFAQVPAPAPQRVNTPMIVNQTNNHNHTEDVLGSRVAAKRQQLVDTKQQVEDIRNSAVRSLGEKAALEQECADLEQKIAAAQRDVDESRRAASSRTSPLDTLRIQSEQLRQQLQALQQQQQQLDQALAEKDSEQSIILEEISGARAAVAQHEPLVERQRHVLQERTNTLTTLQRELQPLQDLVDQKKASLATLESQVRDTEQDIVRTRDQHTETNRRLAESQQKLAQHQQKQVELDAQLMQLRSQIDESARKRHAIDAQVEQGTKSIRHQQSHRNDLSTQLAADQAQTAPLTDAFDTLSVAQTQQTTLSSPPPPPPPPPPPADDADDQFDFGTSSSAQPDDAPDQFDFGGTNNNNSNSGDADWSAFGADTITITATNNNTKPPPPPPEEPAVVAPPPPPEESPVVVAEPTSVSASDWSAASFDDPKPSANNDDDWSAFGDQSFDPQPVVVAQTKEEPAPTPAAPAAAVSTTPVDWASSDFGTESSFSSSGFAPGETTSRSDTNNTPIPFDTTTTTNSNTNDVDVSANTATTNANDESLSSASAFDDFGASAISDDLSSFGVSLDNPFGDDLDTNNNDDDDLTWDAQPNKPSTPTTNPFASATPTPTPTPPPPPPPESNETVTTPDKKDEPEPAAAAATADWAAFGATDSSANDDWAAF